MTVDVDDVPAPTVGDGLEEVAADAVDRPGRA
jgi:hypothetical protein